MSAPPPKFWGRDGPAVSRKRIPAAARGRSLGSRRRVSNSLQLTFETLLLVPAVDAEIGHRTGPEAVFRLEVPGVTAASCCGFRSEFGVEAWRPTHSAGPLRVIPSPRAQVIEGD